MIATNLISRNRLASAMLNSIKKPEPESIDPAHLSAVLEGLAQARSGNYASAADVEAAFRRFDK